VSNATHTLGPWWTQASTANGEPEIVVNRPWSAGGASVCVVESSRRHDVLLADARLIAAAPELLEALETLANEEWRDDSDPILENARTKARAAIAKAKGTK
jgi:hypothetical protein